MMNIPFVSKGSSVYYFTEQSGKNVRGSTSFFNLMQQMASERSTREGYAVKTPTQDMLDADNLRYLEQYTEIYNKYAEQYGDSFELKGNERVASGDDAGRLEVEKYQAARLAFQQEVYNAGIPDENNGILLKAEDLTSGKYTKNGSYTFEATEAQANIKPIITTLMFSGLRSGELIALKWKHINFDAMTITVDGAVTLDCRFDENGNRIWSESIVSSTKTIAGFRTIRVSSRVISVLKEWQEYQTVEGLVSKKMLIEPDCFVFTTKTGEMRTYTGFRSLLRRFLDKNDFGDLGIHAHSFRHTFATILLENNMNPKIVQMYLAHNDVETTLNIYSSVATEVFNKAALRVDEVYDAMLSGTYEPLAPNTECSP